MEINQATGEVTAQIGGQTFRFHATMPKMAQYQAALGVDGIQAMFRLIQEGDARAIYQGLKCLCSSRNAQAFDGMVLSKVLPDASAAIVAALTASLPEPEPDALGNANGGGEMEARPPPTM